MLSILGASNMGMKTGRASGAASGAAGREAAAAAMGIPGFYRWAVGRVPEMLEAHGFD